MKIKGNSKYSYEYGVKLRKHRLEDKHLIFYRYVGVNVKLTADMGGIPPNLYWQKKDNLANSS